MASFSTTELNATIDEKWNMDVDDARYDAAVIMPRIMNKSDLVKKSGDIINLTYKSKYTVGAVGANGAFVPQVFTPTNVAVTINQHRQVAIEIEDRAAAQSFWDPDSDFPKDAGRAMAVDYDTAIAALHSDLVSNVVGDATTPTPFDDVQMRVAMLKLSDRTIPKDDLSFILPPIAFYLGIAAQPTFVDANKSGLPKNVLTTNFRFPLLGIPAYESTLVATTNGTVTRKGFLIHRSTFAIGMQKNNEIKRAERTASLVFSYVVAMQSLYGVRTFREDHGCVINIRNS